LKEKSIVNIGESYLIFSFRNKEMETEEQITDDDLILKIYSNGQEYEPIIIQSNDRVYQVGRSDKCDVYIKDRMLSRIHCILVFIDNNWYIKDGNENKNESTNGTWMFANEETEIKEGMKFKSNSCNFVCRLE
jgi:pSer/pThr/pTyr-binding forkhead associated (FHA) protein